MAASPLKIREVPPVGDRPGYVIAFYKSPYHHYRMGVDMESAVKVPSVTQVLGILDKSRQLVTWATKIDVEGARLLATAEWFRCTNRACDAAFTPKSQDEGGCLECGYGMQPYAVPDAGWKFQQDIKRAGLAHDSVLADAQIRGTTIHTLHEDWVNERKVPSLEDYPKAWRGYVRAYARWLAHNRHVHFESAEVLTGSMRYGFAGTCDTVAVTRDESGVRTRLDFKTSKDVYPSSHFPQLEAYEIGAVEAGDEPTTRRGIVRLGADGTYEVGYPEDFGLKTGPEDFLVLLDAYKSQKPMKAAEDKRYRARQKARKAAK